jgi:hypothetical protein
MLSVQQIKSLLEEDSFNYRSIVILNGLLNEVTFPSLGLKMSVNESQKRLLLCLFNQVNKFLSPYLSSAGHRESRF